MEGVGGLLEFEGGHARKMPSKGGARQKILGVKGGGITKGILSSFAVTASVIMQTTYQNRKNQQF